MRAVANAEDLAARPMSTSRWVLGFPTQRPARDFELGLPRIVRPAMLSI